MENLNQNSEQYLAAKAQVGKIYGFYVHLLVYLVVNAFIIISNYNTNLSFFDAILNWATLGTALFWGIGLASHWSRVIGRNIFLSKKWEERKIQELINKDKKSNWEFKMQFQNQLQKSIFK
jgi:2TM domain